MENLPDNEWMRELETRLRTYNEQPDEAAWNNITKAIKPQPENAVWVWLEYAGIAASVLLAILVFNSNNGSYIKQNKLSYINDSVDKSSKIETKQNQVVEIKTFEDQPQKSKQAILNKSSYSNETEDKRSIHQFNSSKSETVPVVSEQTIFSVMNNTQVYKNNITEADTIPSTTKDTSDTLSITTKNETEKERKKDKKQKNIRLYTQVTPALNYYDIKPRANDEIVLNSFNSSSLISIDRFGLSAEIGVQGHISKKLVYVAGLSVYHQKQTLYYNTVSQNKSLLISPTDPFSFTSIPQEERHSVNYNMFNAGFNAGFLYELKNRGLIHKIGLSLTHQQGLKKATGNSYNNAESSYGFYNVMYRIEYPLNNTLKFYIQPTYSRGLYSNEKLAEPFQLKPSRASMSMGIVFDL